MIKWTALIQAHSQEWGDGHWMNHSRPHVFKMYSIPCKASLHCKAPHYQCWGYPVGHHEFGLLMVLRFFLHVRIWLYNKCFGDVYAALGSIFLFLFAWSYLLYSWNIGDKRLVKLWDYTKHAKTALTIVGIWSGKVH